MIPNVERYSKRTIGFFDYEDGNSQQYSDTLAYAGTRSLRLDSACLFSNNVSCKYFQLTDKPYAWIKASAWVYMPKEFDQNPFSMVVHFKYNELNYKYRIAPVDGTIVKPLQWNYIKFYYLTPDILSSKDELLVYFWLRGTNPVWIDNFRVDVYEPL